MKADAPHRAHLRNLRRRPCCCRQVISDRDVFRCCCGVDMMRGAQPEHIAACGLEANEPTDGASILVREHEDRAVRVVRRFHAISHP